MAVGQDYEIPQREVLFDVPAVICCDCAAFCREANVHGQSFYARVIGSRLVSIFPTIVVSAALVIEIDAWEIVPDFDFA